jgi:hypothetical protein
VKDVKPFFVPPDSAIKASAWDRSVDGEWEKLPAYLDDWDQLTNLTVRCTIQSDVDTIVRSTRVEHSALLAWSIGWRTVDTGLVGTPTFFPLDSVVQATLTVPPDRAGAIVKLTRRLVLRRDRAAARAGEPRIAGSVLWEDDVPVRLLGSGAAFPTEVIDFAIVNKPRSLSWYLHLPDDPNEPVMGSMNLHINSADRELVQAISKTRRRTEHQELLIQHMEEGLIEELVHWALARWPGVEQAEDESVGAAARVLTRRVLADPQGWTGRLDDSMALRAEILNGARRINFGRSIT